MGYHHIVRAFMKTLGDGDSNRSRIIPLKIHQHRRTGCTRTGKYRLADPRRKGGSGGLGRGSGDRGSTIINTALLRTGIGSTGGGGRKRRGRGAGSRLYGRDLLHRRSGRRTRFAIPGAEPESRPQDHDNRTGHSRHHRPPTAPRVRMSMHRKRSAGGVGTDEPLLVGKARRALVFMAVIGSGIPGHNGLGNQ